MHKPIYLILALVSFVSSCSSKNIPIQEIEPANQVKPDGTFQKSAIDSAQVIKINNRNREKSIINSSKSKEKKGL